jgi:glycosyltransferase involved in cell wall biosynthesis
LVPEPCGAALSVRVAMLNYSDWRGGASIAAMRLLSALQAGGADVTFHVADTNYADATVHPPRRLSGRTLSVLRPQLVAPLGWLSPNRTTDGRSLALLPSPRVRRVTRSPDVDLVHLHWVGNEMLSVSDIGRIPRPVVWTLHDMWAFCGAEHVSRDDRYREGYWRDNRPPHESGADLNRWTWNRKRRAWRRPLHIVTPSRWLAECARSSVLMKGWPVTVIPNPIDLDAWSPIEPTLARRLLGLPSDRRLIAFGSMRGNATHHKGGDLLEEALALLRGELPETDLVLFGEPRPKVSREPGGFTVHHMGVLSDRLSMQTLYSAADAVVIPSRTDNLPGVGVEAFACGTPVVAFDTCGLPDIVTHRETGWLARPFEPEDLARGIAWVLEERGRTFRLGQSARRHAEERWSAPHVASAYMDLYHAVSEGKAPA